jgi:hypothetical protein
MSQLKFSATAGEDLTGDEGKAVKLDGSGNVVICTATTDAPVGVCEQGGESGETVQIALPGAIVPVRINGTVKRFGHLEVAGAATGTPATYGTGAIVFAQALEAGVSGDLVSALVLPPAEF